MHHLVVDNRVDGGRGLKIHASVRARHPVAVVRATARDRVLLVRAARQAAALSAPVPRAALRPGTVALGGVPLARVVVRVRLLEVHRTLLLAPSAADGAVAGVPRVDIDAADTRLLLLLVCAGEGPQAGVSR